MLQRLKQYSLVGLTTFILTACGGSSGSDSDSAGLVLDENTVDNSEIGVFLDSAVEGLRYETLSFSGETNSKGEFHYLKDETVKFYVGTYYIGEAKGNTVVTPYQLYPSNESAAISVARLLQTVDADNDVENGITLVNQEQFSSLDNSVSPVNADFEEELNSQIGLTLTVTEDEAKAHLDQTVTNAMEEDTTAPVFGSANSAKVKENQRDALTLKATDTQSSIQYSLSGTDAFSFTVGTSTGDVDFKTAPDYETKKSYVFTVTATDLAGNAISQNITITILDVDEFVADTTAPVFTSTNKVSVNENQIAAITVKATDTQSSILYAILSGNNGTSFSIDGTTGIVTFKTAPDYETKNSYEFRVSATDSENNTAVQIIYITIKDVNEVVADITPPIFKSLNAVSVNENQTTALTLLATDNQSSVTYSLSGTDANSFNINEITGVVIFKTAPDYEVQKSYSMIATASDTAGNSVRENILINILDVDEFEADTTAPVFTSTNAVSVNENQTEALTLVASDAQSSVSYSLSGTNASSFNLHAVTGKVTFKIAPDYEVKKSYNFTATATDISGNVKSQGISITVLDIYEATPAPSKSNAGDRSVIQRVNLAELAQEEGKTPSQYLISEFDKKRPSTFTAEDQKVFDLWADYDPTLIRFKTDNWTSEFDFTGVAWNGIKAGVLITNQHIIVAAHLPRAIGEKVYFNKKDGTRIMRTVVDFKKLNNYNSRFDDIGIHKLDSPVPNGIKIYSIIDSNGLGDFSSLVGSPLILTDQKRKAYIDSIPSFDSSKYLMRFTKYNSVPNIMYHAIVNGDSGGPIFVVINGELVFVAAINHYTSGNFMGYQSVYDALVRAIEDMKNK